MRTKKGSKKLKTNKPGKPPTHPSVRCVETGEVYTTYTEAAKAVNGTRVGVSRCVLGIQKHHHGYHFKFK